VLFFGALLLRLLHLAFISDTLFFGSPIIDEKFSVDAAWNVAQGNWLSPDLEYWKPPLYEYFLAAIFAIAGKALWLARVAQACLDAGSCVLVFALARRLFAARPAWIAGAAAALNGTMIYFTGELVSASLAIFLDLLALVLLLLAGERRATWRWIGAGAVLGLCVLDRAEMLLMIPIAVAFAARRDRVVAGIFVAVTALLVISPVTWHNWKPHRSFVPVSTNGGINFYVGTKSTYRGIIGVRPGSEWEALVRSPPLLGYKSDPEVSDYYRGRALALIRDDPGGYMVHVGKKALLFVHGHELASNYDLYTARKDSPVLAVTLFHARGLYVPFGLIAPLGLVGLVLAWRRPGAKLLAGFVAVQLATAMIFFVTARFRVPCVPVLTIFAAAAAVWLWERRRSLREPRVAAALAGVVCIYAFSNCGAAFESDRDFYRTQLRAERLHFRGTALLANYSDRQAAAARELEAALRLRPEVGTYFNYGRALLIIGRIPEGFDALLEALMLAELDPGAMYMKPPVRAVLERVGTAPLPGVEHWRPFLAAVACFHAHQWQCALDGFAAEAKTATPGSARARAAELYLARSESGAGIDALADFRFRAATASLERAIRLRPQDSDSHLGLGYAYARSGRLDEARLQFLAFRRLERVPGSFFYGASHPDNDFEGALGFSIVATYARLLPGDAAAEAAAAAIRRKHHGH
jgi:4-amino-4-deoxy-L-arabinose transferase-like glycosyltransferase